MIWLGEKSALLNIRSWLICFWIKYYNAGQRKMEAELLFKETWLMVSHQAKSFILYLLSWKRESFFLIRWNETTRQHILDVLTGKLFHSIIICFYWSMQLVFFIRNWNLLKTILVKPKSNTTSKSKLKWDKRRKCCFFTKFMTFLNSFCQKTLSTWRSLSSGKGNSMIKNSF